MKDDPLDHVITMVHALLRPIATASRTKLLVRKAACVRLPVRGDIKAVHVPPEIGHVGRMRGANAFVYTGSVTRTSVEAAGPMKF